MIGWVLRGIAVAHLVIAILVVMIVLCPPNARRYGDRIQIVLPALAWGCAAINHTGTEVFVRFAATNVVLHASKQGLGDAPVNLRPNGREDGFPSGHATAAAFGASSLVHDCLQGHPVAKTLVTISAAFVGGSRIDAGLHDVWQVLAGWLLGWGGDRIFREDVPVRRRIISALRRAGGCAADRANQSLVFLRIRVAQRSQKARPAACALPSVLMIDTAMQGDCVLQTNLPSAPTNARNLVDV